MSIIRQTYASLSSPGSENLQSILKVKPIFGILAVLFAGFFLLNVYFRVKIFRHYRILIDNRIDFGTAEIFSEIRMQSMIDRYPHMRVSITTFCRNMRLTMWMATVFVVLVIIFGFVLLRNH
ncbi:MAG TPA: hypothetical protein VI603_01625 [Saprospiraceae bacterium]|nr:hypothetical protein [Saprospiraceae bacterium]